MSSSHPWYLRRLAASLPIISPKMVLILLYADDGSVGRRLLRVANLWNGTAAGSSLERSECSFVAHTDVADKRTPVLQRIP